ncbi:MAG: efflux RND transporter permease subunit [bacterium]
MSIPSISVKRPVTTIMVFMLIILMGLISWGKLPQELFPPLVFPQITVMTVYANAAPEEIETLITKPIEESIGTVKNLKRITSQSKEGISLVTAQFSWNAHMDSASMGIREKLDLIKEKLPIEANEPVVMKFNPFELPVMILSISAQGDITASELLHTTRKIIKDKIEKIFGVASVSISGGQERQILAEIDQNRLQANSLSILDVVEAIKNTNLNYPAGTTKENVFEYLVRTIGEYSSVKDIFNTVIEVNIDDEESRRKLFEAFPSDQRQKPTFKRRMVTLKDIAVISDTFKEQTSYSRYNEKDNISISILKQSEANTIRTSVMIHKSIEDLRMILTPHNINIDIVYDQAVFIKNSIYGLIQDAVIGGILAFFVILFFLKNIRSSLIVCAAIPVSITASFTLMYMFNISINMMSLGGLALGIGMLVDNAIVVVENIFRHTSSMGHRTAAIKGCEEVSGAIFSSTLTSICVFFPLLWVIGIAGQIFRELSLTVIFSLSASLFVALSLIPRLTSTNKPVNILPPDDDINARHKTSSFLKGINTIHFICAGFIMNVYAVFKKSFVGKHLFKISNKIGALCDNLWKNYPQNLAWFLNHWVKGLGLVALIFIVSVALLFLKEKEFLPKIDQHQFIVKLTLPIGTRVEVTNEQTKKVESALQKLPEVKSITATVGSNRSETESIETLGSHESQIIAALKKSKKEFSPEQKRRYGRPLKTHAVIRKLRYSLRNVDLKNAQVEYIQQDSVFKSAMETAAPVTIRIQGHQLDVLHKLSDEVSSKLSSIPGIRDVRSNMPRPSPETKVIPDTDRAATYNLSVSDIARTALSAIKGFVASKYKEEGEEIDILVRLKEKDRNDIDKLRSLTIHSPLDFNLPIKEVAALEQGMGPSEILREERQRTVLVTAQIYKRSLKDISRDISNMIKKISISGFSISQTGEAERIKESFASLMFVLVFSVILVYMVMAAQFESFWQPFIIMFTIPLSLIGVCLALFVTGHTLNAISMLGIILLGGIVVNNGIVLVDYVNQLKIQGKNTFDSLILASQTRLRPIFLTALTTILGLFPLSLGLGEGAELRSPMAVTVIGGLFISTLLTLFVIPAIYYIIDEFLTKLKSKKRGT